MIRDITLGQYYPVDSVLHRMDPRTKLFGTLVFIVSLFFANSIAWAMWRPPCFWSQPSACQRYRFLSWCEA